MCGGGDYCEFFFFYGIRSRFVFCVLFLFLAKKKVNELSCIAEFLWDFSCVYRRLSVIVVFERGLYRKREQIKRQSFVYLSFSYWSSEFGRTNTPSKRERERRKQAEQRADCRIAQIKHNNSFSALLRINAAFAVERPSSWNVCIVLVIASLIQCHYRPKLANPLCYLVEFYREQININKYAQWTLVTLKA